jgi:hypothetical protein
MPQALGEIINLQSLVKGDGNNPSDHSPHSIITISLYLLITRWLSLSLRTLSFSDSEGESQTERDNSKLIHLLHTFSLLPSLWRAVAALTIFPKSFIKALTDSAVPNIIRAAFVLWAHVANCDLIPSLDIFLSHDDNLICFRIEAMSTIWLTRMSIEAGMFIEGSL